MAEKERRKDVNTENRDMLISIIKKLAKKEVDKIEIPLTFYGFGRVKYDANKCVACLKCYENCPTKAYDAVRLFDLSTVKNADIESLWWKRGIIFQLIRELAQKDLEGYVEVPEGLRGYGRVEHNEELCISCSKCADLCPTKALTFENEINMSLWFKGGKEE